MNKKTIKIIKFFAILLIVIGAYYSVVLFLNEEIFTPYVNFTAFLSGNLIRLFADNILISGNIISSEDISIILSFGCEGSEAIIIFIAGVLAFPTNRNYKIKGLLLGTSVLYFLNIIRIVILYFIGKFDFSVFDLFHNEILPVLFIIISIIAWSLWLKRIPVQK